MGFVVFLIILSFLQQSGSNQTRHEVINIYTAKVENHKKTIYKAIQEIRADIKRGRNGIWKYHDKKMRYMLEKIEKTRVAVIKFLDEAKKTGIDIAQIQDCVKEKISLLKDMDFRMKNGCEVENALTRNSLLDVVDDMEEKYEELKEILPKCAEKHKNPCRVKKCINDFVYKFNRDFEALFWTSKKEIKEEIKHYEKCVDSVVDKLQKVTAYILNDIRKC